MSTTAPHSFAALVSVARRISGMTAAQFDYSLAFDTLTGDCSAYAAFDMAAAALAAERHDFHGDTYITYREELLALHRPAIYAMAEQAKGKNYTGWSRYSTGPIQYA